MSEDTARLLPGTPRLDVSSSLSTRRPASTTVNPDFINASEAARPTPVPAPVTMAILFLGSVIVSCLYVFGFMFSVFRSCKAAAGYSGAPRVTPPTSAIADHGNRARQLRCGG